MSGDCSVTPLLMPHKITGCTLPCALKDQLHIHQCKAGEKLQNLYKTHTSLIIYNHVKFWKSSDVERVLQKLVWPSSEQLPWPPSKSFLTLSKHLLRPPSNLTIIQTSTVAIFKSDHCPNTYCGHLQIWPSSKTPTMVTFKIIWPSLKTYHDHLQSYLTIIQNTCYSHLQIWPSSKQLPQPPSKSADHHPNTYSGMATLKIIWPSSKTRHEYLHRYLTVVDTPTIANSSPAEQCAVVTTLETKVKFCF